MKNSRLLLLMCAVAMLDWMIVRMNIKHADEKTVSHQKREKGSKS